MLGIGAMLGILGGNKETVESLKGALGQTIKAVFINNNSIELAVDLSNGQRLVIWDNGQSCCEKRYMTCEDNLHEFRGAKIVSFSVKSAPDINDGDVHEVQFFEIATDRGAITVSNHNEHNGYYGGFSIAAKAS